MSTAKDTLSVVVPAFNDAENVRRCLDALILARGGRPVEIVVVDDCSTDGTSGVVEECKVTYIRLEHNMGQSFARNKGAKATNSEYILFVDSDVMVERDCFDKVEQFFITPSPDGVIGIQGIFSLRHPSAEWSSLIYNALQHILTRAPKYSAGANGSFFLVARRYFEELGGFREDVWFMEDNEFGQRMAARGYYLLRGPIEFVHLKHVGWGWLFRTHILGGKMQRVLSVLRPASKGVVLPASVGVNHAFLKWLCAGAVLVVVPLVCCLGFIAPILEVALIVSSVLVTAWFVNDMRILQNVKRNPLFLFVAGVTLLAIPWLILVGRALAVVIPAGKRERELWRSAKIVKGRIL